MTLSYVVEVMIFQHKMSIMTLSYVEVMILQHRVTITALSYVVEIMTIVSSSGSGSHVTVTSLHSVLSMRVYRHAHWVPLPSN